MRTLILTNCSGKNTRVTVPDKARVVFGYITTTTTMKLDRYARDLPFVRAFQVFDEDESLLACFTDTASFRDASINYAEEVVREEGASIWKSDNNGYEREEKLKKTKAWDEPEQTKRISKR